MKFSYSWLKECLDFKMSPQEVAELLTLYSFETELSQETKNDAVLDIDLLPNRFADAASHYGVARELQAVLVAAKHQEVLLKKPASDTFKKGKSNLALEIEDQELCSRYSAVLVENVKVGPSPQWLRDKLAVCGVGSINNIVDLTNFVMLELGQPVHAFDFDKVAGIQNKKSKIKNKKIIVRIAKRGEKIITLDGKEHVLDESMLVIADRKRPLALAGIKGGKGAEIDKKTKTILLEAAHFDKKRIFLTAKKLKIESDAARRFASGLDENLTLEALRRIVYLIRQELGGKLADWFDVNSWKEFPRKIKLNLTKVNNLIGKKVTLAELENILSLVGCQGERLSKEELFITPPNYRKDLEIQEDLIEEVVRLQGYANLCAQLPCLPLAPVKPEAEEIYQEKLRAILKGAGFSEVYNYSFLDPKLMNIFGSSDQEGIFLKNPISERFALLRPNLLPRLLLNISDNLKYEKELRLFEIGKVFQKKEEGIQEKSQLGLALSLSSGVIFELKGMIELFLRGLGISDFWFEGIRGDLASHEQGKQFKPDSLADIKISGEKVGSLGKISSHLLDKLQIKQKVAVGLLDIDKLLNSAKEEYEYRPPSKYPAVLRDLAILVDKKIRFSEVLNVIESVDTKFLQDVDLFDIYEGSNLPADKKSLAFHIIYQSENHTLLDEEVNKEHCKIEKALEKELGAVIR